MAASVGSRDRRHPRLQRPGAHRRREVGPTTSRTAASTRTSTCPTAPPTRKVPAVLTTHGFGGDKADSNQTAVGSGFVRQGYAVLSYSGLGFGKTDCKITLDDPDWDGKAGRQMVDVLAGKRGYLDRGLEHAALLEWSPPSRRATPASA